MCVMNINISLIALYHILYQGEFLYIAYVYMYMFLNFHSVSSPPPSSLHMPKVGVNMINDEYA